MNNNDGKIAKNVLQRIFIGLICIAGMMFAVYFGLRAMGKSRLQAHAKESVPQIIMADRVDAVNQNDGQKTQVWQEDWIRYDGKIYEYNDEVMTFLVMGIDKTGTVKESKTGVDGGQADAIFLAVVNPKKEMISIVGINRDTMVDINVGDLYGDQIQGSAYAQLAVQHGYGDGKEKSCQYMVDAVSNLFYQLPINGYVSINMDAIPEINDAVGGVTLTAIEDVYKEGQRRNASTLVFSEGDTVTLKGQDAYTYIRYRNWDEFESARLRLARQKQYLGEYVKQAKIATKQDITLPVSVYNKLSKYMVTNITIDEISYMASEYLGYEMDPNGIYSLEGQTKMGEVSEEFYPDEDALVKLMIDVFYEEVTSK